MAEDVLLRAGTVEITPKVARFGSTSYQIANIGSVSVHVRHKFNLAVWLLLIAIVVLCVWGSSNHAAQPDQANIAFVAALILSSWQ